MKALQKFVKMLFLSVILFSVSCSSVYQGKDNEWTTAHITQGRDMTQYEQGGHFWCSTRPYGNEEDRLHGEKKVRDFIWQHWTEKKRGYIKMTCGQTDTSETTHYFVEPDDKGAWITERRNIFSKSENDKTITDDFVTVEHSKVDDINWKILFKKDGESVGTLPRL